MREITSHKVGDSKLDVFAVDEPGPGGANHCYRIVFGRFDYTDLNFQKGAIKEVGYNGVTQEALIAICIDRIQSFQAGPFACRENAIALTKLQEALMWLQQRTRDRIARNVEGESKA